MRVARIVNGEPLVLADSPGERRFFEGRALQSRNVEDVMIRLLVRPRFENQSADGPRSPHGT